MHLGAVTVPHIAWTWYVLIGAAVTFAVGSMASLIVAGHSDKSMRRGMAMLLVLALGCARISLAQATANRAARPDFRQVSTLLNDAVATHRPPGAVALIGHGGQVVFERAYGDRKLDGEPGLNGKPSPAEPMTENTIFDMASLTKSLCTATAIMQLYEQGKLRFDDPVEKYLPAFNAEHDPERAKVTIRMLLTHTSGEPPDVNLKGAWGLAKPDFAEGVHLALTAALISAPGSTFRYSDINFILLGYMVQELSGEPLDLYAQHHIFQPLGMTETSFLPLARACGPRRVYGSAIGSAPGGRTYAREYACPRHEWSTSLLARIAPEDHDEEGNPATNPDFDRLLRGTVEDPTTRRMGGVAGHAGVFSTAQDVSLFAQALLDRLAGRRSNFPLKQATLELMVTPEQPGHEPGDLAEANAARRKEIAAGEKGAAPGLAPLYPAVKGLNLYGFGLDIDTAFSKPRGVIFPIGSFGHTGFTGTSLWMDPGSDTYVILLANSIHPRGNPPISNLRGEVATAAAEALDIYPRMSALVAEGDERNAASLSAGTLTGIDVLEADRFAVLASMAKHGRLVLGVLTNQTGLDRTGRRTVDLLATELPKVVPGARLVTIFSPEHGIFGRQDSTRMAPEVDPSTGLHVTSLYGPTDADKRPSHEQLKNLDAIVIDLQDAGVRFYTYDTVMGYFLEAAASEKAVYHHDLKIVVLDRPDLIGGAQVQGPVSDEDLTKGAESYIDFMPLPVRNGMTMGELARYIAGVMHLDVDLTVVPMEHWSRGEYFDETGLPWTNPSPNLRSLTAATLYPGLGFLDFSGVSVGRGTSTPFELFGAAWMHAAKVADALNARHIQGVRFTATTTTVAQTPNHDPFHGQTIDAVRITLTDRRVLNSPEMGVEILSTLHRMYPKQFNVEKTLWLLGSQRTLDEVEHGDDPRAIAMGWSPKLAQYIKVRRQFLLYP